MESDRILDEAEALLRAAGVTEIGLHRRCVLVRAGVTVHEAGTLAGAYVAARDWDETNEEWVHGKR